MDTPFSILKIYKPMFFNVEVYISCLIRLCSERLIYRLNTYKGLITARKTRNILEKTDKRIQTVLSYNWVVVNIEKSAETAC
jgi:hypothetical protein